MSRFRLWKQTKIKQDTCKCLLLSGSSRVSANFFCVVKSRCLEFQEWNTRYGLKQRPTMKSDSNNESFTHVYPQCECNWQQTENALARWVRINGEHLLDFSLCLGWLIYLRELIVSSPIPTTSINTYYFPVLIARRTNCAHCLLIFPKRKPNQIIIIVSSRYFIYHPTVARAVRLQTIIVLCP